jgi:parvulin-like peptidyl-prolyl isomerase
MKKPKKIKKLKVPKLPKPNLSLELLPLRRTKSAEEKVSDALSNVPRITNDTVIDHREEVLSSARKYIYPLKHSKQLVVRNSLWLLALVIVGFLAISGLELYKLQTTSTFMYDVTRVVPVPVAKAGNNWVSYESYLFELRRNIHYYQSQQQANFSTKDGKAQLTRLKQQAMSQVIQDAYIKQLAAQNHVSVSNQSVDNQVTLVRSQNRLGNSDRVFKEVLSEFWGWDETDFKRELKQQLLQQAVVVKLDTATTARAQAALKQLQNGTDFGTLAGQISDDLTTKGAAGQYGSTVTINDNQLSPVVTAELFKLKAGQISGIVNTGYTLETLKVISNSGGSITAAHIQFNLAPIANYVKPLQAKHPSRQYIKF